MTRVPLIDQFDRRFDKFQHRLYADVQESDKLRKGRRQKVLRVEVKLVNLVSLRFGAYDADKQSYPGLFSYVRGQ